jgi:oxygen-independent coproporphyrinogen-3 oxidase
MEKGLYIHVPFCKEKCLYCDFYSVPCSENIAGAYVSILLKQIDKLNLDFSTIYIGGGTPSALSVDLLDKLLAGLKGLLKNNIEFTIEANPESLNEEKLRLFIDRGVNRISIGIQSFDDKKLKALGRIHDARQALQAIGLLKKSGFKNISVDLIFGVSGEGLKAWQADLEKAAGSGVQHISCYSLSYEKDTPLFRMREKKHITPLDDEAMAQIYQYTMSYLPAKGFNHYEVSNFSRHGFECKHNLNYWDNNSYVGLGPSAVSYINGARSENVRDIKKYITRYERGIDLSISREKLSPVQRAKETASVKIRTRDGIDYDWFKNKTGFDFLEIEKEALEDLVGQGLMDYNEKNARLTDKGFLFSDTVSVAFL